MAKHYIDIDRDIHHCAEEAILREICEQEVEECWNIILFISWWNNTDVRAPFRNLVF
jgi:hypothetical protein